MSWVPLPVELRTPVPVTSHPDASSPAPGRVALALPGDAGTVPAGDAGQGETAFAITSINRYVEQLRTEVLLVEVRHEAQQIVRAGLLAAFPDLRLPCDGCGVHVRPAP